MSEDIPAGWYPDAQGAIRWWDGRQWTDYVRNAQPPASAPSATTDSTRTMPTANYQGTVSSRPSATTDDSESDVAYAASRRVWLTATGIGLATFFLGLALGNHEQPAAPASPTPVVETSSPELDQREQDLNTREQQLDQREQALNDREQALSDRASATPTPTPTASARGSTITPEDTVLVGEDVPAGTYRSSGPIDTDLDCEFTVSRDADQNDVITENSSASSVTITLSTGQYFTSTNCATWEGQ